MTDGVRGGLREWQGVIRRWRERVLTVCITGVGLSGIAALLLILLFVGKEAAPLFTTSQGRAFASPARLLWPQPFRQGAPDRFVWQPISTVPKVSLVPLWVGTLKLTVLSLSLALPLALLSALFVSEFAPRRLRQWLKPMLELLAGIPSVVLGVFATLVLAEGVQRLFHLTYRMNGLLAALALALTLIPLVFSVAEDALRAVPQRYREASLALGATRWETAWRVVVPAAAPGILAAGVLGAGRALGETLIVLLASGNAPLVSWAPGDSVRTLSATIAAEMGEVVKDSPHASLLFFLGAQLFLLTFALNWLAALWRKRMVERALQAEGAP